MGEIGGNDYNHALLNGWKSKEEIRSFVPSVIIAISSAINVRTQPNYILLHMK